MEGTRLGPYLIVSELGSGGMGTVYLAEAAEAVSGLETGARLALKVIHPHLMGRQGFFKRFLREARVGRRVRHENVVSTFDVDAAEVDGQLSLFLAMEYVAGRTLRSLLAELNPVPEALLREIARQIADGLAAIHDAGIVHRDLKPENVLVTEDHQVRIMDLGVARLLEDTGALTEAGQFAGTLLYAAPEQFGGGELGIAVDLYAVGTLLYELATSMNPFRRDDAGAVIRAHLETVPPRITEYNAEASSFLAEVVATLLAKKPEARFASAALLRDVLQEGEGSVWWSEREEQILAAQPHRPRVPVHRETVLCGRERELAVLREDWSAACEGRGRTVLIEGEAGIGKTRLVDAFLDDIGDTEAHVLYGAYPPSGGVGGLAQAIQEHFGAAHLEAALAPYLAQTPSLAPAFASVVRHVPPPSGAEPLLGDALHTLNVHLMRGLAAEKPVVWVVDDLHFAGPDSRKVALSMARAVEGHPILLLLTARPGLPQDELAHFSRLDNCRRMQLDRLSPREVIELLRDAFRSDSLAERLGGKIAYKSDGVPFFVFEMIRGLKEGQFITERDDGSFVTTRVVDEIEVPSAVRDLVEGRLSRLTTEDRAILDVAAVQGVEFDAALLASVLEMKTIPVLQRLAEMERRSGIVRASGRFSRFDHHQVQEVLYKGLPEALRLEYHAALADAFAAREGIGADDADGIEGEDAVFLATHHFRGSRPAEGRPFLDAALDHLESSWRNEALVDVAGRALAESGLLTGEERIQVLVRRAGRLASLGRTEEEGADLGEALELARSAGDPGPVADVLTRAGWRLVRLSRYAEAADLMQEAIELAREAQDLTLESSATEQLGVCRFYLAAFDEARELFERAITQGEEVGHTHVVSASLGGLGIVLRTLGHCEEARALHERHLAMAREAGDRRGVMNALGNLGNLRTYQREYDDARETYDEALQIAREIGDRYGEASILGNLAGMLWVRGELTQAYAGYETNLHLDRELGSRDGEIRALLNLGRSSRTFGRTDEAIRMCESALALCENTGARLLEGYAGASLATCLIDAGRLDEAAERIDHSVQLFREIGHVKGLAHSLEIKCRLATARGDLADAKEHLVEVLELGPEGADETERAQLLCRLALLGGEDVDVATSAAEEARAAGSAFDQMELAFFHWQVTKDTAQLQRAWTLLTDLRAKAPEAHRAAMLENVSLHRDIRRDWEAHGPDKTTVR